MNRRGRVLYSWENLHRTNKTSPADVDCQVLREEKITAQDRFDDVCDPEPVFDAMIWSKRIQNLPLAERLDFQSVGRLELRRLGK